MGGFLDFMTGGNAKVAAGSVVKIHKQTNGSYIDMN